MFDTYIVTPNLDQDVLARNHQDIWVRGTLTGFEGKKHSHTWSVLYTIMLPNTYAGFQTASCIPFKGNEHLEGNSASPEQGQGNSNSSEGVV